MRCFLLKNSILIVIIKTDKFGRPIYIELINKVNLDKFFQVTTEERMISYYIREYERLMKWRFPACSAVLKKPIEQSLTILDLENIGISNLVGKTKAFMQLARLIINLLNLLIMFSIVSYILFLLLIHRLGLDLHSLH